jgi:hypothetical protein
MVKTISLIWCPYFTYGYNRGLRQQTFIYQPYQRIEKAYERCHMHQIDDGFISSIKNWDKEYNCFMKPYILHSTHEMSRIDVMCLYKVRICNP